MQLKTLTLLLLDQQSYVDFDFTFPSFANMYLAGRYAVLHVMV